MSRDRHQGAAPWTPWTLSVLEEGTAGPQGQPRETGDCSLIFVATGVPGGMGGLTSCYIWGPVFLPFPSRPFPRIPLFTAARMKIPAADLSSSSSWLRVVAVEVEILRRIPSDGEGTQGHLSWGSGRNPLLDFCTSEAALDGAP